MPFIGHVGTVPDRTRHRPLRMGDVTFLLADTLAAVRMGGRVILFEPFAPPGLCEACEAAHRPLVVHPAIEPRALPRRSTGGLSGPRILLHDRPQHRRARGQ
jgi:hypothetical protein